MNEIIQISHALAHKAKACNLTVVGNQRTHAFSMIESIAELERLLQEKQEGFLAKHAEGLIKNCEECIKTTNLTGKCYQCSGKKLEYLNKQIEDVPTAKWEDLKPRG